jgi:GH35 family endo-1,4-beta-xylanase
VANSPYSDYSDADQAALMESTLRLLFSHPAVKGITLWGFWEGNIWIPNSGAFCG